MSVIGSNIMAGASGQNDYQISRSVRLRSSASAYFSRTPSVAGNRKTWTWSGWVKRAKLGSAQRFFRAYGGADDNNNTAISFDGSDRIEVGGHTVNWRISSAVFRDVSAYYHVVVVFDTPNATANNRIRIYVNNAEITSFSTLNNPSQNFDLAINGNFGHWIGANDGGSAPYLEGYLTDIHFVDGQALTPASFGEIGSSGVWSPKQYTGTYGTNGFKLNFSDNSAATSTAIGKDSSGNNNNWTPNNISVTSGVTYDSMLDVPTRWDDGGNGRGNYCTLNPLSTTAGTYSDCNLKYVGPSSWYRTNSTVSVNSGKWYWEVKISVAPVGARNNGSQYNVFGWGLSSSLNSTATPGVGGATDLVVLADSGFGNNFSGAWTDYGAVALNDILAVAVDLDANTFAFYRNNTQIVSGTIGMPAGTMVTPIIVSYSASAGVMEANFGQRPFAYTPPAGFKALNTQNINAGTVITSGTFTGNLSANGPAVWTNGVPVAMTVNGNAVTFGTHADRTASGFKVRSGSSSYNNSGTNTYSVTSTGAVFKHANAQVNP